MENKLIRQNYEQAKVNIKSLKETVKGIMEQMSKQSVNYQALIEQAAKDRDALKDVSSEMTNIKLNNVELIDALNDMTLNYEKLISENRSLELELENMKKETNKARIFPVNTSEKEDSVEKALGADEAYLKAKELVSKINEAIGDEGDFIA